MWLSCCVCLVVLLRLSCCVCIALYSLLSNTPTTVVAAVHCALCGLLLLSGALRRCACKSTGDLETRMLGSSDAMKLAGRSGCPSPQRAGHSGAGVSGMILSCALMLLHTPVLDVPVIHLRTMFSLIVLCCRDTEADSHVTPTHGPTETWAET